MKFLDAMGNQYVPTKFLSFDDVSLIPQESNLTSRNDPRLSTRTQILPSIGINVPIISTCMDTVTESDMAIAMVRSGGTGILHRFYGSDEKYFDEIIKTYSEVGHCIWSVGVKDTNMSLIEKVINSCGKALVCIDVAHGHAINAIDCIKKLRSAYVNNIEIIGANVATSDGAIAAWDAGANAVRVGIGGGCFVPGSIVNTDNGPVEIERIKINDRVYTHTGDAKEVIATIYFEKDEDIMNIDGIRCTKNHEFHVVEKSVPFDLYSKNVNKYAKWVKAEDLRVDSHFLIKFLGSKSHKGFFAQEIKSITTEHYKGKVYDLTVADDHSYNIDNIIVHNSLCTTRLTTGHGVPTFTNLIQIKNQIKNMGIDLKIYADGGIKRSGDIVKALSAGADAVMCGRVFAGTEETPGEIIQDSSGQKYKKYRGQSSRDFLDSIGKAGVAAEGESTFVKYKGSVKEIMEELAGGIRSGFTYSGANNVLDLQDKAKFIEISYHSYLEGTPHLITQG